MSAFVRLEYRPESKNTGLDYGAVFFAILSRQNMNSMKIYNKILAKFTSSAFRGGKQNSRVVTTTKLPLNAARDQFNLFYYEITIKKSGLERM